MADLQIDWAKLLQQAQTEQASYAALANTTNDTVDTTAGVASNGGTLDQILDRMVQSAMRGAPGSTVAREVAGLIGQARRDQYRFVAQLRLGQQSLKAANAATLLAAAKIKAAHDRVINI